MVERCAIRLGQSELLFDRLAVEVDSRRLDLAVPELKNTPSLTVYLLPVAATPRNGLANVALMTFSTATLSPWASMLWV